jgi:four helix bundle protein
MNKEDKKKISSFTDLNAWKEGHELVLIIYRMTDNFPKQELFGLVNQMRRCVVSITSNIAEGFGRKSYKEKIKFYLISQGSVREIQNQLIISRDVGYIDKDKFQEIAEQTVIVHKIINGLIKGSRNKIES